MVEMTNDIIEAGKSRNGGWSEQQFLCLGITWAPVKGWKSLVIGRSYPEEVVKRFLNLKDKHLPTVP
jgi:hypothetical protein